jgi:hypothetical protein
VDYLGELGKHPIHEIPAIGKSSRHRKRKRKTMKMITKSAVVAGVAALAVTTLLAKGGGSQPVHNVHFTSKVVFTNSAGGTGTNGSGPSATGQLSSSISGNTDKETLNLNAKGLVASNSYSLFANTSFGTNLDVFDFNADKKGNAKLALKNTGNTKKPATLPSGLEVFNITELDIVDDSNTNSPTTILTSDTTMPKSFSFSDKLSQTGTNGETGTLTLTAASGKSAKLSLTVAGLNTNSDFLVALNGTSTTNSFTSDSKGNLKASTLVTENVLDLTEVDLTDTSSAVIIPFVLP